MQFIKWDDSLLIGVEEIDNQHKRLFLLINRLQQKLTAGHGKDALEETLQALIQYVYNHFSREDAFMASNNYPEIEEHRKEHAFFAKTVKGYQEKYRDDYPLLARDILIFLSSWYRNHIGKTDKKIGEYIRLRMIADNTHPEDKKTH